MKISIQRKWKTMLILLAAVLLGALIIPGFSAMAGGMVEQPAQDVFQVNSLLDNHDGPKYECESFDLIFLVDQSGSMTDGGNKASDPFEQRIEAVRWTIENIGFQVLNVCTNDVEIRVAVVPFGGKLDPNDLTFTKINPSDATAWENKLRDLKASIAAADLGETDFEIGFERAADLLDRLPASSPDARRGIIVITDGTPCSVDMQVEGVCGSPARIRTYMAELQEQIWTDFSSDEYYMWIIGINQYHNLSLEAQKFYDVAIDAWRNITTPYIKMETVKDADGNDVILTHGGYIQLGKENSAIPDTFVKILELLSQIDVIPITCGPLPVNPYLERAQLNFFRNEPNFSVTLTVRNSNSEEAVFIEGVLQPGNTLNIPVDSYKYNKQGLNESYNFKHPVPGMWAITMDSQAACSELRAQYLGIEATVTRTGPTKAIPQYPDEDITGDLYDVESPVYLEFEVLDRNGDTLPNYGSAFPIIATLDIKPPSGKTFSYGLRNTSGGIWQSSEPLPATETGQWTYSIVGTAAGVDGKEFEVLPYQEGIYSVGNPVSRFSWHVVKMETEERSATRSGFACWSKENNVVVQIALTDFTGPGMDPKDRGPLAPNGVLDGDPAFVVQVEGPESTEEYLLDYIETAPIPGTYRVVIPGEDMIDPGEYILKVVRVAAEGDNWGERGVEPGKTDSVKVKRFVDSKATDGACTATTYSIIVIILILIGIFMYFITGKPKGWLYFEDSQGNEIAQIGISGTWRKIKIAQGRLGTINAAMENADLTKIIVAREGTAKEHNQKQSDDTLDSYEGQLADGSGKASVNITIDGKIDGNEERYFENEIFEDGSMKPITDGIYMAYYRWGKTDF